MIDYQEALEQEEKEEQKAVSKYQKEELPRILVDSKKFILEEKYEAWKKLCITNSKSLYSISIIKMVYETLVLISEGKSFEEAISFVDKNHGSSGYTTGMVVATICEFAIVGEELRKYWNSQYSQEDIDGTINPAVIHF